MTLDDRLDRIEAMLERFLTCSAVQAWYSVAEFARVVGRSEFTCREWCRLGRIVARKKVSGRGAYAAWAISNAELGRYRREGLLPAKKD